MEMTRNNIMEMGLVAMQLGIAGPEELEKMARFWVTWKYHAEYAAEQVITARAALHHADFALAAFRSEQ